MQLETERLILRRPEPRDMDAITAFFASERSKMAGGNAPLYKAWLQGAAMLAHWDVRGFGLWAVTLKGSGDIVGLVGPFYPDGWPETEFGWLMFDGAEGKGIAFEAAQAALKDARERLGWTDIVHYIDAENTRSIALAERLGATRDEAAPVPKPDDPCLVYRQPKETVA